MGSTAIPGGSLSRLVGKPPVSPWLPRNILPLKRAANGPNSAISLTQTFDRISLYVYNSLYFGVQKAKNGDRGTIVFTATLRLHYTRLVPGPRFLLFVLQNISGYKMRLNVCFNEIALFGLFAALIKGCSSYGRNGGQSLRGDG